MGTQCRIDRRLATESSKRATPALIVRNTNLYSPSTFASARVRGREKDRVHTPLTLTAASSSLSTRLRGPRRPHLPGGGRERPNRRRRAETPECCLLGTTTRPWR